MVATEGKQIHIFIFCCNFFIIRPILHIFILETEMTIYIQWFKYLTIISTKNFLTFISNRHSPIEKLLPRVVYHVRAHIYMNISAIYAPILIIFIPLMHLTLMNLWFEYLRIISTQYQYIQIYTCIYLYTYSRVYVYEYLSHLCVDFDYIYTTDAAYH